VEFETNGGLRGGEELELNGDGNGEVGECYKREEQQGGKDKEIQIKRILRQRRRFGTLFQRIRTV